jgi:hypothetical protein
MGESIGIMTHGYNSGYRHFLIEYFKSRWLPDIHHNIKKLQEQGKTSGELDFMTIVDQFAYAVGDHIKHFTNKLEHLTSRYNTNIDFVLAGYHKSVATIISISSDNVIPFAPKQYPKSYYGGVNEVGIYWKQKLCLDKLELPIEFLKKFAVMAILETIKANDMCGEPIQMAVIDKTGFHGIAMIDEEGHYHDDKGEIEDIKNSLDAEHKWLFDYLK